jgi:leucine dehydrogenase
VTVAVQGVGHVGYYLCEDLAAEGAKLIVTDIDEERVQRVVDDFGAQAVGHDEIYGVDAQVFAPCALGAVVNDETLPNFKFQIIAGAANNQLAEERHGKALMDGGSSTPPTT